ncbi:hypothetical protein P154DRAFT_523429 [Amniculicola lignicola CBS 123094]|uniref:Uncharacterized protein n=1 Tax=Amniculicola lignicola CBS 123094 TaxID=1392246 RepID=A0A6A5WBG8_9PLEO|nr:hypothetical protein P154DRAFT_523429 [Amniculicola lignicola CBS 123094]
MPDVNGTIAYRDATVDSLLKREGKTSVPYQTNSEDMQLVLRSFELLIADLFEQFGVGMSNTPGG